MLGRVTLIATLLLASPCLAQTANHDAERPQDPFIMSPGVVQRAGPDIILPNDHQCGADAYAHLVGRPLADVLDTSFPREARLGWATGATTLEFKTSRLNVVLDARGRIVSIACF